MLAMYERLLGRKVNLFHDDDDGYPVLTATGILTELAIKVDNYGGHWYECVIKNEAGIRQRYMLGTLFETD